RPEPVDPSARIAAPAAPPPYRGRRRLGAALAAVVVVAAMAVVVTVALERGNAPRGDAAGAASDVTAASRPSRAAAASASTAPTTTRPSVVPIPCPITSRPSIDGTAIVVAIGSCAAGADELRVDPVSPAARLASAGDLVIERGPVASCQIVDGAASCGP